jgi:pyruvate formate lyase activating enzyme
LTKRKHRAILKLEETMIFDLQRFSTHDGPGIRTVVFFKGCTLSCTWCQNPESQSLDAELLFKPSLCVGCGSCLDPALGGIMSGEAGRATSVDRSRPLPRGAELRALAGLCPSLALRVAGREATSGEIVAEVMKDGPFFAKSGGGVTFSGGEPLAQSELLSELVAAFREREVGMAIETCLAGAWADIEALHPRDLLWLVDLKHMDPQAFRAGTGGELSLVLDNARALAESGAEMEFRVPVIPAFNDDEAAMRAIFEFAAGLGVGRLDLLPFHSLGAGKYAALGRANPYLGLGAIKRSRLERYAAMGTGLGLDIAIGGR